MLRKLLSYHAALYPLGARQKPMAKARTSKRPKPQPGKNGASNEKSQAPSPSSAEPKEAAPGPPQEGAASEQATIIYPGTIKGRATIELRVFADGHNEAYLVPTAAAPIPTGVPLVEKKGKYFLTCRIRKKKLAFKPEEVVRQKVLNYLIDELLYLPEQIGVEVGVQMGSTIHEKPADIVVYTDDKKSTHWLIVETKKPNRKDGVEQLNKVDPIVKTSFCPQ